MICVKTCATFLLVIAFTDIISSVNGRLIDQPVLQVYEVPDVLNLEYFGRGRRNVEHVFIEKEMVIPAEPIVTKSGTEELKPQNSEMLSVEIGKTFDYFSKINQSYIFLCR